MVRPSRYTKHLAALAAVFAAGCSGPMFWQHPRTVAHTSDVANVYVTTLPPMDFNDIREKIAIHHVLTDQQCRELAAQTTGSNLFQYISQIAFGASVALPAHTVSNTTTTNNGTPTSTGSVITGSASIPSGSNAPANGVTPSSLTPDLTKPAPPWGIDGEAQILGGTAICQTAALVEQQIASAKLPDDYDAYVITFQVNVQPKARDLSYDTDIDIQLWPTDKDSDGAGVSQNAWARPAVMVKPLIITDVLESTSIARSMMAVRQFAASLSGVLPSLAAINAGGSNSSAKLEESLGADRNTVLTMGNPSANTIRIHLGAPSAGSQKFAMVPRTFNVSTLVLLKKPGQEKAADNEQGAAKPDKKDSSGQKSNGKKPAKPNDLVFISHLAFRSTDPAVAEQPIPNGGRKELATRVKTKLCQYNMQLSVACGGVTDSCSEKNKPRLGAWLSTDVPYNLTEAEEKYADPILDVLRHVDRQNLAFLNTCVVPTDPSSPEERCSQSKEEDQAVCKGALNASLDTRRLRLYSELAEIKTSSNYSTGIIALPERKAAPSYPPGKQLVSMVDDGKSATTIVLHGGANLDGGKLRAYATVSSKTCKPADPCILLPTGADVSKDGSTLTLTFPSLSAMKPASATLATITLATSEQAQGGMQQNPTPRKNCANEKTNPGIYCYDSFFTPPSDPENNYTASVSASTPFILADASGSGFTSLTVNVDKVGTAAGKSAFLRVKGATVTGANAASSVFSFSSKGISVASSGTAPILLGNLTPGQLVTVQVTGPDNNALSEPYTLYVVPQAWHK